MLAARGGFNSGDKIKWETLYTEHEKDIAAFKCYIGVCQTSCRDHITLHLQL